MVRELTCSVWSRPCCLLLSARTFLTLIKLRFWLSCQLSSNSDCSHMSNNVRKNRNSVSSVCRAHAIRNVCRYILPCIGCSALIWIIQDVWCLLPLQIIILCLSENTLPWLMHKIRVLPLLTAWLCYSQPLLPIVPVPWHLCGGMMQRQPWRWSHFVM